MKTEGNSILWKRSWGIGLMLAVRLGAGGQEPVSVGGGGSDEAVAILQQSAGAMRQSFSGEMTLNGVRSRYAQQMNEEGILRTRMEPRPEMPAGRLQFVSMTNEKGVWHLFPRLKMAIELEFLPESGKSRIATPGGDWNTAGFRYEVSREIWRGREFFKVVEEMPEKLVREVAKARGSGDSVPVRREYRIDPETYMCSGVHSFNRSGGTISNREYEFEVIGGLVEANLFSVPADYVIRVAHTVHDYSQFIRSAVEVRPEVPTRSRRNYRARLDVNQLRSRAAVSSPFGDSSAPLKVMPERRVLEVPKLAMTGQTHRNDLATLFVAINIAVAMGVIFARSRKEKNQNIKGVNQ